MEPDEYTNLIVAPKGFVFGEREELFRWEGNERTYVTEPGAEAMAPTVIFGMRPCDVSALEYLDDFYLANTGTSIIPCGARPSPSWA